MREKPKHVGQFGNLVGLRPINNTTDTTITKQHILNHNNNSKKKTKTMEISEPIYEKLKEHSRKYHDQPISYDEIIEELCTFYNKNNDQKWF